MVINFNIERLDKLLYDFHCVTGLTVSLWDAQLNMLSFQPKQMSSFCRRIREYPEGNRRCLLSDKAVCEECARTGKPVMHICHAGLADNAMPIKFQDEILGYMMFGQVVSENKDKSHDRIRKLSEDLGIDYDELITLYGALDTYDEKKLAAAANILEMSTRYLWFSKYIEIKHDSDATRIERYIRENLSEDLSLKVMCASLGISKNRLYKISHERFGMPIGDYISEMRIKEAKRLLTSTNIPINKINEMVGISDYNYFSKFFKAHTGMPPNKYRKTSPIGIFE